MAEEILNVAAKCDGANKKPFSERLDESMFMGLWLTLERTLGII